MHLEREVLALTIICHGYCVQGIGLSNPKVVGLIPSCGHSGIVNFTHIAPVHPVVTSMGTW